MKAHYTHDCSDCMLLGTVTINGEISDLYYCGGEPTILARHSSEASDNSSGLCFGEGALVRHLNGDRRGNTALMVAYVIALANGLDVTDKYSITDKNIVEKISKYKF